MPIRWIMPPTSELAGFDVSNRGSKYQLLPQLLTLIRLAAGTKKGPDCSGPYPVFYRKVAYMPEPGP